VTEEGENEQLRVSGSPEQAKPTALLNAPLVGVTVTVRFAEPPDKMLREEGLVPSVKFPTFTEPPQFSVN